MKDARKYIMTMTDEATAFLDRIGDNQQTALSNSFSALSNSFFSALSNIMSALDVSAYILRDIDPSLVPDKNYYYFRDLNSTFSQLPKSHSLKQPFMNVFNNRFWKVCNVDEHFFERDIQRLQQQQQLLQAQIQSNNGTNAQQKKFKMLNENIEDVTSSKKKVIQGKKCFMDVFELWNVMKHYHSPTLQVSIDVTTNRPIVSQGKLRNIIPNLTCFFNNCRDWVAAVATSYLATLNQNEYNQLILRREDFECDRLEPGDE